MTSYAEHFAQDRRLTILKILDKAPQFTANEFLLQAMLAGHGHSVSRDLVRTDLAWLAEQALVRFDAADKMGVGILTERGADVAAGRATVPGVKRPAPGAG
jgi:hypothetical protein